MCAQPLVVLPSGIAPPMHLRRSGAPPEPAQTATYRPWSVSNPAPATLMVAFVSARLAVGSTINVRVPPAELTVVDASAPAASGIWVGSGAAAWAGARLANTTAAPAVARANAAAANRARLIGTFRQVADCLIGLTWWSSQDHSHSAYSVLDHS